jgi:hypothetical protein
MLATTESRSCAFSTARFWTSTTSNAAFGRFSNLDIAHSCFRSACVSTMLSSLTIDMSSA